MYKKADGSGDGRGNWRMREVGRWDGRERMV